MSNADLMAQEIQKKIRDINSLKSSIKDLKARRKALSSQPVARHGESLSGAISSLLGDQSLIPKNVGGLNHVAWPFWYTVDFDLSQTNDWPNLTSNTRQTRSFQVSQEAAFLMMGIIRHAEDYNDAGDLGPLTIEFRDRQSSRFFNDAPIPIQMFGQKGYYSYIAVPMILLPNAFFELSMGTLLADGVSQNVPGGSTGVHTFTVSGYRIRVEDAHKVLSSIFG